MYCIDLTSKRSKMLSYVAKHSKNAKLQKWSNTMTCIDLMSKRSKQLKTTKAIKLQWIASIWRQTIKNVELRRNAFKTTQNYKSNQITMTCIDLMSKRSKHRKTKKATKLQWIASIGRRNIKNVELRRKTFKPTQNSKLIKLQLLASILSRNDKQCWVTSQNIQNNAKLQKRSNYNELHRFDVKTIKNVELRRKTFKTTLNYKSNQITMTCIDLMSKRSKHQNNAKLQKRSNYNELHRFDVKRSKMLSYVAKHSKQRKTTKVIKLQLLASIWRQNDKNVELRRKTFKTTQNYKTDQITITCIDFNVETIKMLSYVAKHSKQRKTTKVIKLQWIASIDVKTIKNVELRRKTFKPTQNYKSDQITITCINFKSKR